MFVMPREGVLIPHPDRGFQNIPPEGAEVPDNAYWRRRIADGDAVEKAPLKKVTVKRQAEA